MGGLAHAGHGGLDPGRLLRGGGGLAVEPADARAARMHLLAQAAAWPAALADSRSLLDQEPERAEHWFNHAYLLERMERWPEAVAAFRRATALAPAMDRAWYGLGLVLIRLGDLEQAAEALVRNTTLQPLSDGLF